VALVDGAVGRYLASQRVQALQHTCTSLAPTALRTPEISATQIATLIATNQAKSYVEVLSTALHKLEISKTEIVLSPVFQTFCSPLKTGSVV
jgi:hypothetical protein